ncbi:MAG: UDP-N-acetylglucosamine 1-carboxyvinyltransferase [Candidatus Paceibacterota bacterium]|jgi:UDP-N-acetylglucosamine 1-carboxyvinyltransferase
MNTNKERFVINGLGGEKKLRGTIPVYGSKNAILPVMAATVLFKDEVQFSNIPHIEDVARMAELLTAMGAQIESFSGRKMKIAGNKVSTPDLDSRLAKKMRASVILTGSVLGRFGKMSIPHPGGCVIGARPIDLFIDGFQKMGAKVELKDERYKFTVPGKVLKGAEIFFKMQSVTATEAFIMAGVLAKGKTVLKNVAMEPEIISLAEYLVSCGAKIKGIGSTTLEIAGTAGKLLSSKGKIYKTIPDRLEAGGFAVLAALCGDDITITGCNPADLQIIIDLLKQSGVPIETTKNTIRVHGNGKIPNSDFKSFGFKTHEHPGFPTDVQAPMTVFLTQATGEGLVFETIFEGRLNYTQDLVRMGADVVMWDPHRVMVKGPTALKGKELEGPDIRAGLAFVIAAIVAKGKSTIDSIYYIDRGYEKVEERLRAIGVDIQRVKVEEAAVVEIPVGTSEIIKN